ncbi:MAG: MarR family winged helix-turn-helix transcriptional regulator [Geminicoccaceae bacterium]
MTEPNLAAKLRYAAPNPLFLRDEELTRAIELLDFAYRALFAEPNRLLAGLRLGRNHQRIIHFVGRYPGIAMGELLEALQLTKQSLSRLVKELVAARLIVQTSDRRDRRQRVLQLTERGRALDEELSGRLRRRLAAAYRAAGADAVAGYHQVLLGLVEEPARRLLRRAS